jgi:endogenous inhibitor of DNA gyrase (YacG/DUF329 family)
MAEESSSWIMATGQAWKLYVAIAGLVGGMALFSMALFSLVSGGTRFVAFVACGAFLSLATFAWFAAVVRCHRCHAALVWKMMASRPFSSWLIDLAALERCPACHAVLTETPQSQ